MDKLKRSVCASDCICEVCVHKQDVTGQQPGDVVWVRTLNKQLSVGVNSFPLETGKLDGCISKVNASKAILKIILLT